jgi:hypothetical protein
MQLSLWVDSKAFLGHFDNRTEVIDYLNSKQNSTNGSWGSMFDTHRILLAYFELGATPAIPLDTFFNGYDTWTKAQNYMLTTGSGDARNMYHIIFGWVTYYHTYPSWMSDFFNEVEQDPSWTNSWDFHKRTHILYSYVVARRPFPNLDGIINATLAEQEPDGHWDGSMYNFYSTNGDVYFTSIQITLLSEILKLYQGYRTTEIQSSLDKAKAWTNSTYHTEILNGKACGFFGDIENLEQGIFAGILCAGQTGLIPSDVDMTFQSLVDTIAMERADFEYSPEKPIVYEQIAFNASASYSPGGNITSYEWNFGDENATEATAPIINHSYVLPGNYTVTLKVTDDKSLWNTTAKTITVYSERVYTFDVSWQGLNYTITTVSNSTVANFNFNYSLRQVSFNVTGLIGTMGYCNVSIPKTFMWCDSPSEWNVTVDGSIINNLMVTEGTSTSLFFTYSHSTCEVIITAVHVIPEFPSVIALLSILIVASLGYVIARKKRSRV